MSARTRTHYFDSRFVYFWKVVHTAVYVEDHSPSQSTKTSYIVRLELANSVFLHLVLLSLTPVASNSFFFPSLRSCYTVTLSITCFWIFLRSRIQSGEETDVRKTALESLFTFTLPVFSAKQGAGHKRIQLMKGFYFPSTSLTNSIRLILGNEPVCFEGRNKSSVSIWSPESQIWHTDEAGASLACYQSTLISGTSFFSQWYFPSSGRSTNEILLKIVANSPFLGPSRPRHPLARSCEPHFTRPNRRACS